MNEPEPRPRTFYGDPDDTVEELILSLDGKDRTPPRDGDELCDGHISHYLWEDGKWQ